MFVPRKKKKRERKNKEKDKENKKDGKQRERDRKTKIKGGRNSKIKTNGHTVNYDNHTLFHRFDLLLNWKMRRH